jgi:hypothetical protein
MQLAHQPQSQHESMVVRDLHDFFKPWLNAKSASGSLHLHVAVVYTF